MYIKYISVVKRVNIKECQFLIVNTLKIALEITINKQENPKQLWQPHHFSSCAWHQLMPIKKEMPSDQKLAFALFLTWNKP